ncbi:protease [Sulfolobus islandicus rod-shaped virus 1]|uniref:Uncharacterized protein 440 n=1 Tax=Sulfolobus islandicus rod-shaped virus 1 TaxID=157898 RepID=Y440_SIRV1|nr:protease [Sulfolobus islandicus rod-shaped virus 1]Q8QL43.1 RecName: Full=Uncharacterized protein 440 [Sulfolobus islandicus rod-shaped virus 1]CAC93966.1 hypothetical protein [Sulfolobus islandicus rod-shaped virus 1]CAG38831.1 hypothetical protein [Sulfolobus islandicus rudivirus 1 variant XX]
MSGNQQTNSQLFEKLKSHSFFYNPRDNERILSLILGEKQVEENKKIEILKAYKRGIDSQYFSANLPYYNEIKFISKITGFKVKDDLVIAKFQNGFTGDFDPHEIADNPDDFYNLISSYMFVKIKKGSENWFIDEIFSIEPPNNFEIAKEILEEADKEHLTYAVLLQAFGYDSQKMDSDDIFLTLPRLFPLFKSPITKRQINTIEISNRGTGKTTTFMILQEVFNFRYYTEPPTYANLIYDARNNMYGSVFLSNGLIFDEIQTWKDGYAVKELNSINSTLSTGIENCIWTRGAGTESKSATIQKCIPIIYAGNPFSLTLDKYQTPDIESYLQQYEIFTPAILDRIHIIQLAIKKTYDKIINARVLYPSILRALVELIQEKINRTTNYADCGNLESRRKEQSIDIQIVLQALDIDLQIGKVSNEEVCNKIVNLMRFSNLGGW